jgi:glycogen operon protein
MTQQDWNAPYARAITMAMSGATGDDTRPDDPFLLMLNAWWEPLVFTIPDALRDLHWQTEVDTFDPSTAGRDINSSAPVTLQGRSLMLLHANRP